MFVHIVFKCNNPNLCVNLGELLISFRALSLSIMTSYFCPIDYLDLLIASFIC
jgi:hypothetical protein